MAKLIYSGSVKDVYLEEDGAYRFQYSNRYSIFDWGPMPDELAHKGEALAVMADLFFRFFAEDNNWRTWQVPKKFAQNPTYLELRNYGLPHHSLGLVGNDGAVLPFGSSSNCLKVKPVQVLRPQENKNGGALSFDYSQYQQKPVDALVPLEIIFRLGLPSGSSFLARAQKNPEYLKEVGLSSMPKQDQWLEKPVIEFSTKLETSDRMLVRKEAQKIAGLSDLELQNLHDLNTLLALRLKDLFQTIGVELWDGKFEFAFCKNGNGKKDRSFFLVDSIGPDELRLLVKGTHLSKEVLRQVYRKSNWYSAVEKSKIEAKKIGNSNWKKICTSKYHEHPPALPKIAKIAVEEMYPSLANALAQSLGYQKIFSGVKNLKELLPLLKELPTV